MPQDSSVAAEPSTSDVTTPSSFNPITVWQDFLDSRNGKTHSGAGREMLDRLQAMSIAQQLDVLVAGVNAHQAAHPRIPGDNTYSMKEIESSNAIERFRYSMASQDEPVFWRLALERQLPVTFWAQALRQAFPGGIIESLGAMDLNDPIRDPAPLLAGIPPKALMSMIAHIDYASKMTTNAPAWLTDVAQKPPHMTDALHREYVQEYQRHQALVERDHKVLVQMLDRLPSEQWDAILKRDSGMIVMTVPMENLPVLLRQAKPDHLPEMLLEITSASRDGYARPDTAKRKEVFAQLVPIEVRTAAYQRLLAPSADAKWDMRLTTLDRNGKLRETLRSDFKDLVPAPPVDEAAVLQLVESSVLEPSSPVRPKP